MKVSVSSLDTLFRMFGGQSFTVCFIKANGESRVLTGRKGVSKHLKGGNATFNGTRDNKGNIGVYEYGRDASGRWSKGEYKAFKCERVKWVKFRGKRYDVI